MERRLNAPLLAIVVAASLLLAVLAIASTISASLTVAHGGTTDQVRRGQRVALPALAAAERADEQAAAWFESARYDSDAAAMLIAAGGNGGTIDLDKAEKLVRRALAASPAQPYNWARLAYLKIARQDLPAAVAAWKMSILTGRYVPYLMRPRLILGLQLLATHDPELTRQVSDQVLVYARTAPFELAKLARALGAEPFVRATLLTDPAALSAFNQSTGYVIWLNRGSLKAPRALPAK